MLCTYEQYGCLIHAGPNLVVKDQAMFRTAYETKIDFGSNKAEIVLPGI